MKKFYDYFNQKRKSITLEPKNNWNAKLSRFHFLNKANIPEAYLEPSEISTMELFCKNIQQLLAVKDWTQCFCMLF